MRTFVWFLMLGVVLLPGHASGNEVFAYRDSDGKLKFSESREVGKGYRLVSKEGWELITSNESSGASLFMQTRSLAPKGKLRKAWFLWSHSDAQKLGGTFPEKTFSHSLQLHQFDCSERTFATSQQLFYLMSENVHSINIADGKLEFREVAPETVGEAMLERVCRSTSPPTATPPKK